MNRILIAFLFVSSILASVVLTDVSVNESGYEYTFGVSIDDSKYVTDFMGIGTYTYYENMTFTTTTAGQYQFTDIGSSLTNGSTNTAVLLYNNPDAVLITDEPWAFYNSDDFYFGGGQDYVNNMTGNEASSDSTPFNTTLDLNADTQYTAVFTAFQDGILGGINVKINSPSQLTHGVIPEPKDTGFVIALIVATFVAFSYFYTKLK